MKKIFRVVSIAVAALALLTGCGKEFSADVDTVYVEKKGGIKGANVATFDKDYYSESELSDFINDAVNTYVAKEGDGTVAIADFGVTDGIAHVYLDYAGYEDYAQFNGVEFFAGTVLEAQAAGYEVPGDLKSVTEKETQMDETKNKLVIVGQQTTVRVDGEILFVSDNVTVNDKNSATVAFDLLDENATCGYVVYK